MPDFSHVCQWPPQPSSVMGMGLMLAGVAVLVATGGVGVELGVPLLLGGAGMVAVPDSSSEHAEDLQALTHQVSSLRAR
jgi:hypothetical protein